MALTSTEESRKLTDCRLIRSGAFGRIYFARNSGTKHPVAIKRVSKTPRRGRNGVREAPIPEMEPQIQGQLDHENIVKLIDYWYDEEELVMAFEWMHFNLREILPMLRNQACLIKNCIIMILKGLQYIHDRSIMHRDIKPDNFLVSEKGIVKLADFGLARHCDTKQEFSCSAGTLNYRAPELLFGSRRYDHRIDLWSVGCVFAELYANRILFPGETEIGQLGCIISSLGDPIDDGWIDVKLLPDFGKISFEALRQPPRVRGLLKNADEDFVSLIEDVIVYDPTKRATARFLLNHSYLSQVSQLEDLNILQAIK